VRRQLHIALAAVAVLLNEGCEESFSPKTEFKDQYVLQCFVEGSHIKELKAVNALLAKVYDVDGFDPYVNTTDPAVGGAEITLLINGKPYFLREGFRQNMDSTRYGPRQRFYYASLPGPQPYDLVSIVAKLPGGQLLSAQTTITNGRAFTFPYEFPHGLTTFVNLPPGVRNWTVSWDDYEESWGHLFFPRLRLLYRTAQGEIEQDGSVLVPSHFVSGTDGSLPAYPSYTTQKFCTFEFPMFDWAMAQISADDPNKNRYSVHKALFEVIEYDTPLSKYYSSVNGSLDQFSIRVDQMVYSNISGGIGIFGSYIKSQVEIDLDISYVKSFGYRYR
jgi:hypothetical protein